MSLYLRQTDGSCLWGVWRMDETPDALRARLPSALCEEADRRFSTPHRRQEWLSVRLLLQTLLGAPAPVSYLSSGKPVLADGSRHISISHTRGYVAVILGSTPVGIDIEQYGPRVHRVASRFMRPDEVPMPYQGDDTWSLLLHWSAKEVMFKCLDTPEVDFREHLRILPFVPQAGGTFRACEYRTPRHRHFLIRYLLHPDFVLTWQVDGDSPCSPSPAGGQSFTLPQS